MSIELYSSLPLPCFKKTLVGQELVSTLSWSTEPSLIFDYDTSCWFQRPSLNFWNCIFRRDNLMKNLSQLHNPLGLLHLLPQKQLDVKWMHVKEKCIQNYTLVKCIHLLSFIICSKRHGKEYLKRINKYSSTKCQIIKSFLKNLGGFIWALCGFRKHCLDK